MPASVLHCTQADEDVVGEIVKVPEVGSALQVHPTEDGRFYALVAPINRDGTVDKDAWGELVELNPENADTVNEALGTNFEPNA